MTLNRMKILGIYLLVFSMFLLGCSNNGNDADGGNNSSKDDEKVYEMNINNWGPSTNHLAYNALEPWQELVEEKTNGRVKVNLFHGGSLGDVSTVYQDIKGGLYEVGILPSSTFGDTEFYPFSIGTLPFAFEGSVNASKVMQKFAEENIEITDVITMPPVGSDPYLLWSTKSIKTIDDIKNLKVRTGGKAETEFVKSLGAVPVSMNITEMYEGLQRKSVDAGVYSVIGGNDAKMFEPAPNLIMMNSSVAFLIPIMNKDFFNSLPEDLQNIFTEELMPELSNLMMDSYKNGVEDALANIESEIEGKGEIIRFSESELADFKTAGRVAWDSWIEETTTKGYDGQELIDNLLNIMEEEGLEKPF